MASVTGEVEPKHSCKDDVATVSNNVFRPLLLAGSGGDGDVWICTRNPEDISSTPLLDTLSNKGNCKSLYAVKISNTRKVDSLSQEVSGLKHIATISAPNDKHMQHYVDHDRLHERPSWVASQAIVGCTLWQLHKAAQGASMAIPKPLVLTIALQICHALQALQASSTPLFHEDLCHSNIVLDIDTRDGSAAPTVVVIDFARAQPRKSFPDIDLDLYSFHRILGDLASWGEDLSPGQDSRWDAFVAFVVANNSRFEKQRYEVFCKLFESFGRDPWDAASEGDRARVNVLLDEASKIMFRARALAQGTGDRNMA
ncbi:hypothetical protein PMIN06_005326 [Paraphaeosphaeria minitans]